MVVVAWVAACCAAWLAWCWIIPSVVAYVASAVVCCLRRLLRGVSVPSAVIEARVAVRFWWFWCAAMMRGWVCSASIWVRSC